MDRILGTFEQMLLFALVELEEDAHGVGIGEFIAEKSGQTRSPGSIHTTLDRLAKRGLVTSHLGEPTAVRGGRRKRYYRLTPEGARALRDAYEQLLSVSEGQLARLRELAG